MDGVNIHYFTIITTIIGVILLYVLLTSWRVRKPLFRRFYRFFIVALLFFTTSHIGHTQDMHVLAAVLQFCFSLAWLAALYWHDAAPHTITTTRGRHDR